MGVLGGFELGSGISCKVVVEGRWLIFKSVICGLNYGGLE